MADKKISQLTSATLPLAGTEILPMVQGGATVKALQADLFQWPTGRVTYVPIGGNIQAAVTAATAGDTLILGAGTYTVTSTITVDKAILIKGQGLSATKVTSATAGIAVFTLTASTARITDLYIGHSGTGTTYGVVAGDGLSQLQLRNLTIVMSGAGLKYCVWSQSSITVSDTDCYPTSSDQNSNGVVIYNDSAATVNVTANLQNVRVLATGATLNNRGFVFNNNNTSKTITGNIYGCNLTAFASSGATDVALYVQSTTTFNVTVNAFDSVLQGADTDVVNTGTNVLTLSNCTLVNGTTTGTITYGGTQVGSKAILSSTLTMGDNVVQGTAAKGFNFTANTPAAGKTSQLLNWYEEGTWTPVVSFTTPGDLTVVHSVQQGHYVRIGNLVTFTFRLNTSTFTYTTASGAMVISGLPFTAISTSPGRGSVKIDGWNAASISTMGIEVGVSTSTINIFTSKTAASSAQLNQGNFTSATNIGVWGTASYFTS